MDATQIAANRRRKYHKKRPNKPNQQTDAANSKPSLPIEPNSRRRSRSQDPVDMELEQPELKRLSSGQNSEKTKTHLTTVLIDSLPVSNKSKAAARTMGYKFLTQVQAETLPIILEGADVLARARTGTGSFQEQYHLSVH